MKVVTNPAYPFLADFFCHLSDRFETEGITIYEGRNVLKRFNIEGCELVVKSFKVPFFVSESVRSRFRIVMKRLNILASPLFSPGQRFRLRQLPHPPSPAQPPIGAWEPNAPVQ